MEQEAIRYNGKGFALRGEKNRLALPLELRKDVLASSGGERILCLALHHEFDCLIGFGTSRVATFDKWLEDEQRRYTELGKDFNHSAVSMALYSYETVPFDASGRFVLDDDNAELGFIENEVFFNGAGDFFTIWNPDILLKMEGREFRQAQISCRNARGKAKKGSGK